MDKQKVAIEDFAKIKKLGSLTLSPSGKKAAFTVTEGSLEDNGYHTDIWVYDEAHTPALYRLTAGEDGKAPVFLDEDTLLFPGDRKKRHTGNAAENETGLRGAVQKYVLFSHNEDKDNKKAEAKLEKYSYLCPLKNK